MEDNNIIQMGNSTVIINGGNALEGCPTDFPSAEKWENEANAGKDEFSEPQWKFDCGFKLDFDGPLLRISSRFYPPKTHYGPTWDGNVTVYIGDTELEKKVFDCKTIEDLKTEVETYIKTLKNRITIAPI